MVEKETIKDKVRRFSKSKYVDDTLEHSRYGIAGEGTRYGWDYLVYQANTKGKEAFLEWLKGVILILRADLKEPAYPERVSERDKKMWKRYLSFLEDLKKQVKFGSVVVSGKISKELKEEDG